MQIFNTKLSCEYRLTNKHKHKHQTQMNIPSVMEISLYNVTKKTWMISVSMRIKSCFIIIMTKAMTRVLSNQRHLDQSNITNLSVQWNWTLTTYHNTLIITISFNNKIVHNHQLVHSRLAQPLMKNHNVFEQPKNTTSEIILTAKQYIMTRKG